MNLSNRTAYKKVIEASVLLFREGDLLNRLLARYDKDVSLDFPSLLF
jgi:hypothetical protein